MRQRLHRRRPRRIDEFTLKRIRKEGNRVFLMPENDRYQPIEVTEGSDFEIWGRVIGSVREY